MIEKQTESGVPYCLAMDAWWLTEEENVTRKNLLLGLSVRKTFIRPSIGLVVLVTLGDFLFWGFRPGFSLAIFALAIFTIANQRNFSLARCARPMALMLLSILPVLEYVQPLSVMILSLGTLMALAWSRLPSDAEAKWICATFLGLSKSLPVSGIVAAYSVCVGLRRRKPVKVSPRSLWRNWAFPVGGAFVLGSLLLLANPILARVLSEIFDIELNVTKTMHRAMFGAGLALMIWPMLNVQRPCAALEFAGLRIGARMGLNSASVLRSLIVFNAFLFTQSVLDFSVLFAGASLPEGMSYATYVHRGAYPLLLTAVLAGAFALGTWAFLKENRWIQPLILLWVTQNALLSVSTLMRLNLYIAEYGLTYLRIYALIWICLVAVGLVMIIWHILAGRKLALLVRRIAILGAGTLYLCAFVNFAGLITTDAITRAAKNADQSAIDWSYLCGLGNTVNGALARGNAQYPHLNLAAKSSACTKKSFTALNWRENDLRRLRAQHAADVLFD
ncbi:MAG: DUF4173 domain-containing protein [Roseobacter sp.]